MKMKMSRSMMTSMPKMVEETMVEDEQVFVDIKKPVLEENKMKIDEISKDKEVIEAVDNLKDLGLVEVSVGDKTIQVEKKEKQVEKKEKPVKEVKPDKDEIKREKLRKVREEEEEVFVKLSRVKYEDLKSNAYSEMDTNVEMVLQGLSYGVIIQGKGGVGKTFRVMNTCFNTPGVGAKNVKYVDSFTTPSSFYVLLYENRDKKVIVLDDVHGLMDNPKILAMLKGALWHTSDGKTRVVNYLTTKPLLDEDGEPVERSFEMNARIIILTNYLNEESPHVQAILSRVNKIDVVLPYKDLLDILTQVVDQEHKGLSISSRYEVFDFLKAHTTKKTQHLNIRTLLKMFDYKIWAENNNKGILWQVHSLKLLEENSSLLVVEKILDDESLKTSQEKEDKFTEETGQQRAQWFRLKSKVLKRRKEFAEMKAEEDAKKNNNDGDGEDE